MENQVVIKVEGMTCSNCARSVESAVAEKGGSNISVNLADKEVVFENANQVSIDEYAEIIEKRGYVVVREVSEEADTKKKS